jgi:hypothetical protein
MPDQSPRPGEQHPEPWRQDLNPDANAGQNVGLLGAHPEVDAETAYDRKEVYEYLREFTDDELKQIPILPSGSRLEQNARYVDLRDPSRHEFTAMGNMEAGPDNLYVPKAAVDYVLWNRLIGVQHPERLNRADEE